MSLRLALSSRATAARSVASRSAWRRQADLVAVTASRAGLMQVRSYAVPASKKPADLQTEEDTARVWRSIEDLQEDWDPAWDNDVPEAEYEDYGFGGEDFGGGFDWQPPNRGYEKFENVEEEDEKKPTRRAAADSAVASAVASATAAAATTGAKQIPIPATAGTQPAALNAEGRRVKDERLAIERFRIGTIQLPAQLRDNIVNVLKGYPKAWLRRDSAMLSEALRARTTEPIRKVTPDEADSSPTLTSEAELSRVKIDVPPIQYNKNQTMAYVAHRIPGIYSCNYRVLHEISRRAPEFAPKRMLDFGSGPGTTTWAASQVFPSVKRYILVEPSDAMVSVSAKILEDFPVERRRFLHQGAVDPVDIVVASYSLSELSNDSTRSAHVKSLWNLVNPGGMLVIIEAGTPIGFKVVRAARAAILETKTGNDRTDPNIVAPCTHNAACPQPAESWCHFIQRVERTPLLRSAKQASVNWENEKFSYVAIRKGPRPVLPLAADSPNLGLDESRLIRQPLKRGGHIIVDACTPTGRLERVIVPRSAGKEQYKSARKATWGDTFYLDRLPGRREKTEKHRFWWSAERRGKRRGTFEKQQFKQKRLDEAKQQITELRESMSQAIGRSPSNLNAGRTVQEMHVDPEHAPKPKRRSSSFSKQRK